MKSKQGDVKQPGKPQAGAEQGSGSNPKPMGMMKSMMEKMMAGMMKPEDMPPMMNAMMGKMFSGMSSEDRKQFIATIMPTCLRMMFAELDSSSREKLAREMLDKMIAVFKEQLPNPAK